MKTVNQIQNEIIEEFSLFEDWQDKYALLIEMGNELPVLPSRYKTANNLIEGCQSRVWLAAEEKDSCIIYQGDSDAVIVKGMIALLVRILSHHTPEEILDSDLYFLDTIGLRTHLSPTRSNGLASMLKQMRLYALAFKATAC